MIKKCTPHKIADNFYCLGPEVIPSFILDGHHPVMIEAGIYAFGPHYMQELNRVLDGRHPEFLFLTHMHFDHCGAAGYLKRMMPGMKIGASPEGRDIISKSSARDLIRKLNSFGDSQAESFETFSVESVLDDGYLHEVSPSLHIEVIKTPGHTRDMLSYYIPELKTLIPSESIGVPDGEDSYIFSEFLIGYDVYYNSLLRLQTLDIERLVIAHNFYYTGVDAKKYIGRALDFTEKFRERLERLLRTYDDDFEAIAKIIKKEEYDPLPVEGKQPEEAYLLNLHAKIRTIYERSKKVVGITDVTGL